MYSVYTLSVPVLYCMQIGAYSVASMSLFVGFLVTGGRKRLTPVGGSAYGMPLKILTSDEFGDTMPLTVKRFVLTMRSELLQDCTDMIWVEMLSKAEKMEDICILMAGHGSKMQKLQKLASRYCILTCAIQLYLCP